MSMTSDDPCSLGGGSMDPPGQIIPDSDIVTSLQSQLKSLRCRIEELEAENLKLSSKVVNCCCHCHKMKVNLDRAFTNKIGLAENITETCDDKLKIKKSAEKISGFMRSICHHSKRYVALKVMYFGQRFYGFALEAQKEPTVESEIFIALEKTNLLLGDKKAIQYSRCGRTDKGVSSVGQVIAMFLPSNLKAAGSTIGSLGNIIPDKEGEIDYVKLLNRVLPNDIRVMGWSPAPIDFSARFNCLTREYRYLFWRENLNVLAMDSAAQKFVGEHDFRNFCKMDAVNVHNYERRITSFEVSPSTKRIEGSELWVLKVRGSAFLWHQIRCMVSVLFMIGQGLESPNVIDALLDVERTSRKPQYIMASEVPLILYSCEFESLKFTCSSVSKKALRDHMENEWRTYEVQASIFREAMLACDSIEDGNPPNGKVMKKRATHVPLLSRPLEPSYEERRAKIKPRMHGRVLTSGMPVP